MSCADDREHRGIAVGPTASTLHLQRLLAAKKAAKGRSAAGAVPGTLLASPLAHILRERPRAERPTPPSERLQGRGSRGGEGGNARVPIRPIDPVSCGLPRILCTRREAVGWLAGGLAIRVAAPRACFTSCSFVLTTDSASPLVILFARKPSCLVRAS